MVVGAKKDSKKRVNHWTSYVQVKRYVERLKREIKKLKKKLKKAAS